MCVTNIAKRRSVAVANATATLSTSASLISQSLMGNYVPLMLPTQCNSFPKAVTSTGATQAVVEENSRVTSLNPSASFPSYFSQASPLEGQAPTEKKNRPKRRRKPQKPGKTAKLNDRHFVVHNYHDHAADDPDENDLQEEEQGARRVGGSAASFPTKLHMMLDRVEADGLSSIVSWRPHGRCFIIHKPQEFVDFVLPRYLRQNKLTSFQRQLNLYGFARLTRGKDSGSYYHELFLRGKRFLSKKMLRTKIKGTKFKAASSPDQEPDFYSMPHLGPSSPHPVSDDSSSEGGGDVKSPVNIASFASSNLFGQDFSQASPTTSFQATLPFAREQFMPSLDPVPLLTPMSSPSQNNIITHTVPSSGFSTPFNFSYYSMALNPTPRKVETDDVLDAAVDELFHDSTPTGDTMHSGQMWDIADLEEDTFSNDIQLGSLLQRLAGH